MTKLRLKRHGSFSIREGWFQKAINALNEFEQPIFSRERGIAILGIGANMVTSLRYWLLASRIIKGNNEFSEFGNLINDHDRFLENNFSWWLIHYKMVTNWKDAPIMNIVFNNFELKNFSKDTLVEFVLNYMREHNIDMPKREYVESDITVLLKNYTNEEIENPEDNLNSPLGKLGLLDKNKKNNYNFIRPRYDSLHYLVVYYSLIRCVDGADSINIDDLMSINNSPSKIFNLDKILLNRYLDDMKNVGLISINRTAGLNMIYIQKSLDLPSIFEMYWEEGE